MDKDKIKKALDHFENDEFTSAKDIIKKEIASKRDSYIKDKLGLSNDINPAPAASKEDDNNDDEGDE